MKNILVAGDLSSQDFVNRAYGDLAAVTFARNVEDARAIIEDCPSTIMVGTLAFDESRFLSLLPLARSRKIKVVVVDCPYTVLDEATLGALKAGATELGISAWWDMRRTLEVAGTDLAAKEIRAIVRSLLN